MIDRLRAWLLRSPLHRLAGRSWLLLRVPATAGAAAATVAVRAAEDDGRLLVLVADAPAVAWWKPLVEPTDVEVVQAGRRRRARAHLASGEELERAVAVYLHRHPGAWTSLGVPPDGTAEDVATASVRSTVVVITPADSTTGAAEGGAAAG